jgi:hypothetical protein
MTAAAPGGGGALGSWRERKGSPCVCVGARNGGAHLWRGKWRASKNGGWEEKFGGACKMEVHLKVLLELIFFTKPLNFGVESHT